MVARATSGLSVKEIQKHFESSVKDIPTITKQLQRMVGNGRLIVFIDDLDRCIIENALGILDAIKLFLNAKNVLFVIAVDMTKLERAWMLRYHRIKTGLLEGREHIDKIFQLKLSLPPKRQTDIESYIKKLASSLPDRERKLLTEGCPPNPRKIKRVLNLLYFLVKESDDDMFEKYFPLLVIWSIATIVYPLLSVIIRDSPKSLIQMALIVNHVGSFENFTFRQANIKNMFTTHSPTTLTDHLTIRYEHFSLTTMEGLEYLAKHRESFYFIKSIAQYYDIWVANEKE
jgi:KAP family P-loop domain